MEECETCYSSNSSETSLAGILGIGILMEKRTIGKRPRIYVCHHCGSAIKNPNNYQRHMETHDLVTMGWLWGRDYVSPIKSRHKLESYSPQELPEAGPVVIIPSKRGEANQGRLPRKTSSSRRKYVKRRRPDSVCSAGGVAATLQPARTPRP